MSFDGPPKLRHLLHRMWDKNVGKPDYVKDEWIDIERAVNLLDELANQPCTHAMLPPCEPCLPCRCRSIQREVMYRAKDREACRKKGL